MSVEDLPPADSHIETELRVFNVEARHYQAVLESLGATCLGVMNFKRAVLDVIPANPNKWIRVRTDGTHTTLAVKERLGDGAAGTGEHEVEVSDFDKTLELLESLGGYTPRSVQENRRIAYDMNGVEVSIDSWPKVGDLIEIEGPSEAAIHAVAAQLGIRAEDLTGVSVEQYYQDKLGIDVKTVDHLTFE